MHRNRETICVYHDDPVASKLMEIEGSERYLGGRINNIMGKVSESDSHVSRLNGGRESDH